MRLKQSQFSLTLPDKTDTSCKPHVSCISKGKAHKPYEFGSKVSISRTRDIGIILGALALPGNSYDGHTVQEAHKQIKKLIGKQPENLHRRPGLQRPKGIWQNPFADSFCPSKNRLSIRSTQAKEMIPQNSRAGSHHQSLKTAFSNG